MGSNHFQLSRVQRRKLARSARNVVKRIARKEARRIKILERDAELAGVIFGSAEGAAREEPCGSGS